MSELFDGGVVSPLFVVRLDHLVDTTAEHKLRKEDLKLELRRCLCVLIAPSSERRRCSLY